MVSWLWLILAFFAGMGAGVFFMGLCAASKNQ